MLVFAVSLAPFSLIIKILCVSFVLRAFVVKKDLPQRHEEHKGLRTCPDYEGKFQ